MAHEQDDDDKAAPGGAVDDELRRAFDEAAVEPVPDALKTLAERLDRLLAEALARPDDDPSEKTSGDGRRRPARP